jgi:hypothetical protein
MPEELKPDQDEPAPPPKGERWLKVVYWTVGVLAALAIAGALWLRRIDAEHQKILQEAQAAVETLRVEPVPDEENAARDYERAFSLFSINPRDYGAKFTGEIDRFKLDIGSPEVTKLLADDAPTLAALEQAATKPYCIFVTDYSAGLDPKHLSLLHARTACLLLVIAARRAAYDGRHTEAAERIRQALCLSRGIAQPRRLFTHMVSVDCEDRVITALRDILTQTEPNAETLVQLGGILREHAEKRPRIAESMHVERLLCMLYAAELVAGTKPAGGEAWDNFKFMARQCSGLMLRDARAAEKLWNQEEAALAKPAYEGYQELTALAHGGRQGFDALGPPYSWIMPSLFAAPRSANEELGLLHAARLAVACRLHQVRTGKLPNALAELSGQFPADFAEVSTDPFTGKSMLYKRSDTGFVVYSVGAWDPLDNGAPLGYANTREPDLTFPVDRKAWEDYRTKSQSKPRTPVARPAKPPAPAQPR